MYVEARAPYPEQRKASAKVSELGFWIRSVGSLDPDPSAEPSDAVKELMK